MRKKQDDYVRVFICSECAKDRSKLFAKSNIDLSNIFLNINESEHESVYSCGICGTTIADIVENGRPGCCHCYLRFSDEIDESLKNIHGRNRHVGKAPMR